MGNRLASATSPYLLQHADNPVDWWQWGDEAFAEARRRDVPVLLSRRLRRLPLVPRDGARVVRGRGDRGLMNEHFVNVKVDREERPDVDAVYMEATHAMTGQGGWPMTVRPRPRRRAVLRRHLLPDQPRHGQPAFRQVLEALAEAWRTVATRSAEVAGDVADHLRGAVDAGGERAARRRRLLDGCRGDAAGREFDAERRRVRRRAEVPAVDGAGVPAPARRPAPASAAGAGDGRPARCDAMARGGMYDQLGGGFARYSRRRAAGWCRTSRRCSTTTRSCSASTRAGGGRPATRSARGSRARRPTSCSPSCAPPRAASPPRSTPTPRATRASSTSGRRPAGRGARRRGRRLGRRRCSRSPTAGTFEHGASTLQLRARPRRPAALGRRARRGCSRPAPRRVRPARDDKVVAAWNGLAIAVAGRGRRAARRAAATSTPPCDAARLLRRPAPATGATAAPGLPRRRASGRHAGVLEDYGDVAEGFWRCSQATGDAALAAARAATLLDAALATSRPTTAASTTPRDDAEPLVAAPRDPQRQRQPVRASRRWCTRCSRSRRSPGRARHRDAAEAALRSVRVARRRGHRGSPAGRSPRRRPRSPGRSRSRWSGRRATRPRGAACAWPGGRRARARCVVRRRADGRDEPGVPLLAERGLVDGPAGGLRLPRHGLRAAGHDRRELGRRAGLSADMTKGKARSAFPFTGSSCRHGPSGS